MADGLNTGCPPTWRDPSGWRPAPLQYSVPPEARGERFERWIYRQVLATPEQIQIWLQMHGPDNKAVLESVAPATGRDNYGLVGKAGKKAKKHDRERWKRFQDAVKS